MDKEPIAALVLGKLKEKKGESSDSDDGLEAVAQELIDAVESKDAAGVADALRSAYSMCGAHGDDE